MAKFFVTYGHRALDIEADDAEQARCRFAARLAEDAARNAEAFVLRIDADGHRRVTPPTLGADYEPAVGAFDGGRLLGEVIAANGQLTSVGAAVVRELVEAFVGVLTGEHTDNTGAPCRVDLRGHDCCGECNFVQEIIEAVVPATDEG